MDGSPGAERADASVVVRTVAAAVRAGAPPERAWAGAGARVVDGAPRADRLAALGFSPGAVAAVQAASRLGARVGAPPVAVLESLAGALDAEAELAARRAAALAGPRASARLLALLPLTGPLLGAAVGADPVGVLTDGRAGTALLVVGVGLALLGRWWSAGLMRSAADAGSDHRPVAHGVGAMRAARSRALTQRRAAAVARGPSDAQVEVPVPVLLELLAAAATAGASVPEALDVVGRAAPGKRGPGLVRAGSLLALGAGWDEAWLAAPADLSPVARALRPAWLEGAPASDVLRAAAGQVRRERRTVADEAAARLGVRLLLPLAVCHLPAFVLVGLVPVLASLARSVFGG